MGDAWQWWVTLWGYPVDMEKQCSAMPGTDGASCMQQRQTLIESANLKAEVAAAVVLGAPLLYFLFRRKKG